MSESCAHKTLQLSVTMLHNLFIQSLAFVAPSLPYDNSPIGNVYHIFHLIAVMALFAGTGAALGGTENPLLRRFGAILRGIALLLLPVTGFGMLARAGMFKTIPLWVWIKVAIWLVAAVLPIFVKRKVLPATIAVFIALALGGVAAWLGYLKPIW